MKQSLKESIKSIFHKFNVDPSKHGIKLEEIKLEAQKTLQDGTIIYSTASEFAVGVDVYTVDAEGNPIPLPAGEYVCEEGGKLVVGEDGLVAEYTEAEKEAVEEEMSSEQFLAIVEKLTSRLSTLELRNSQLSEQLLNEQQKNQKANAEFNSLKTELSELRKKPAATSIKDRVATTTVTLSKEKPFEQMTLGERIKYNISQIKN
jgi:hypothetical protein